MGKIIPTTKDNASGQLSAVVQTSSSTYILGSGEGANFPQPKKGTATSAGDSTTLNSTGIGSSVSVGDIIFNLTDSSPVSGTFSLAVVKSVSTDSVTTTPLRGGTGNTWDNADDWVVNPFVVNFSKRTGGILTGAVTAYEKVLITERSTDTLKSLATSGYRGFDGTTIQEFASGDFVTIEVDQSFPEGISDMIGSIHVNFPQYDETVRTSDAQTVAGVKTFSSFPVTPSAVPTTDYQVSNKKYVDDTVGGNSRCKVTVLEDVSKGDPIAIRRQLAYADIGASACSYVGGQISTGSERAAAPIFGNGTSMSSLNISIQKVGAPNDIIFRIETDGGSGAPSGTLVDANATVTVSAASITTSVQNLTVTFPGSFTITDGDRAYLVMSEDTITSGNNYYILVGHSGSSIAGLSPQDIAIDEGSGWTTDSQFSTGVFYLEGAGFELEGGTKSFSSHAADYQNLSVIGVAQAAASAGQEVDVVMSGEVDGYSSLKVGWAYSPENGGVVVETTESRRALFVAVASDTLAIQPARTI